MRTFNLLGTPLVATTYEEFTAHCQDLVRRSGSFAVDLTILRQIGNHGTKESTACFRDLFTQAEA